MNGLVDVVSCTKFIYVPLVTSSGQLRPHPQYFVVLGVHKAENVLGDLK